MTRKALVSGYVSCKTNQGHFFHWKFQPGVSSKWAPVLHDVLTKLPGVQFWQHWPTVVLNLPKDGGATFIFFLSLNVNWNKFTTASELQSIKKKSHRVHGVETEKYAGGFSELQFCVMINSKGANSLSCNAQVWGLVLCQKLAYKVELINLLHRQNEYRRLQSNSLIQCFVEKWCSGNTE